MGYFFTAEKDNLAIEPYFLPEPLFKLCSAVGANKGLSWQDFSALTAESYLFTTGLAKRKGFGEAGITIGTNTGFLLCFSLF